MNEIDKGVFAILYRYSDRENKEVHCSFDDIAKTLNEYVQSLREQICRANSQSEAWKFAYSNFRE